MGENKRRTQMMKKIVVAVDLMEGSDGVLTLAGELALKLDADLSVVHIYEATDVMATFSPYLYPGTGPSRPISKRRSGFSERRWIDSGKLRRVPGERLHEGGSVDSWHPWLRESEGADLLVIGTHRARPPGTCPLGQCLGCDRPAGESPGSGDSPT